MPEGPEVETVVRTLKKILLGKKILDVKIYYDNVIEYPSVNEFITNIKNETITDIFRKGKWIIFKLNSYYLLSHLRMEGKYFIKDKTKEVLKHEHIIFSLDDNTELRYHDTRKFGRLHLIPLTLYEDYKFIKDLGVDPFTTEFNTKYLKNSFSRRSLPIKSLLLDQKVILGIGNIYANEILFMSKINPLTKPSDLNENDYENIITSTKQVLKAAIDKGGTTIKSYTSAEGVTGLFQHELLVHGKKNCPSCQNNLLKIKVGGRGTYYCQTCQKETLKN